MRMTPGSYQDALRILAGRRRPARPLRSSTDVPLPQVKQHGTPDLRGKPSIVGMRQWLQVLGHSDVDINALNIIHVAGTKGKGSTCAFTETFLRTHGKRTGYPRKLGLYTSPHLIVPQERIRINFEPLSEEQFAKYFFEVYRTLEQFREETGDAPRHLQLWALVAFHTFIREDVNVAIIETHHGGEFDATNFIQKPVATVVTTLGMDHVEQLGPQLSNIAWHKAGIFKSGAAAISAPQASEAMTVLHERAVEKGVALNVIDMHSAVPEATTTLPSEVLRMNCVVALTAANAYLRTIGEQLSPDDIEESITAFKWPGRFQQVEDGDRRWYLDAAHNELSMGKAAQWFAEAISRDPWSSDKTNTLVFSHISSHRDGGLVLRSLLDTLAAHHVSFDTVIFTTYRRSERDAPEAEDVSSLWEVYSGIWREYYPTTTVSLEATIDRAVGLVRSRSNTRILATGSQYLLGGILQMLPSIG